MNTSGVESTDPHDVLHRRLDAYCRHRLVPGVDESRPGEAQEHELRRLELAFVEGERARVRALAGEAPQDADAFVAWFESLRAWGPGQDDPLFEWLELHATREQMAWFLRQEVAGEAGFDDLVALTQVKMPTRVKLELARNYWDEMGQGHEGGMHGPMLSRLTGALGIAPDRTAGPDGDITWESLALGNLMVALAVNRPYAHHSIGALGVIELTAPGRALRVNAGLKRLDLSGEERRYFALHATLDVKHWEAWRREVVHPLVRANPRLAPAIAEGALMRLTAGARCFERYHRELRGPQSSAA
ncbi:MAG: iron-containing redox enzyme family protein [Myxococcota bacterium]|nr:iron-containing redox enzyme family protein [Myxococcota bacterium]